MRIENLFKYRNIWMGLAIIWVVLYHAPINYSNIILEFIRSHGYGGVDIFIFASGIGCYFSYKKDYNLMNFIKRRFFKIMPIYLVFIFIWLLFEQYRNGFSLGVILGNIFCIQELTGNGRVFNWYMCLIWILYFFTPYFVNIVDSAKCLIKECMIFIILFLCTIPFWGQLSTVIVIRALLFYLGMCFAKKSHTTLRFIHILIFLSFTICGCCLILYFNEFFPDKMWGYGLYWYPFVLIVPGLCISISLIANLIEKVWIGRFIINIIGFIGKYTFEIYLTHILIIKIYEWFLKDNSVIRENEFSIILLAAIPISVMLLRMITKIICNILKKFKHFNYRVLYERES